MIFSVLLLAFTAQAGEMGLRAETPTPTALAWASQTWTWEEMRLTGWISGNLFPLRFGRAKLELSFGKENMSFSGEGVLLGSGRLDLFLSGTIKGHFAWRGLTLTGQAGGKFGIFSANFYPAFFQAVWAVLSFEKEALSGELKLEGPSPWRAGARFSAGSLTLRLGSTLSLEVYSESGPWSASTTVQIWPRPEQTHVMRRSGPGREFQVTFRSSSQFALWGSVAEGPWKVSAFFLWERGRIVNVSFEVVRAF